MGGSRLKNHSKKISASNIASFRDSCPMPTKCSNQQAKDNIAAKKRNWSEKTRKHKQMSLSSIKGKNPFVKPKHVYDPVTVKWIFMELHPDGWKLDPECDY